MPPKKPKPDEKPQRERFIEAARDAEADETEKGFEQAFKQVVSSACNPTSPDAKPKRSS